MAQLGIQHQINQTKHRAGYALFWLQRAICDICTRPFHMQSLSQMESAERMEHNHRVGLLRLIILGYIICLLFIAIVMSFFKQPSAFLRWSDISMILLSIGCLLLSYRRWTTVVTIVFLFFSLSFCLAIIEHDINALNDRSVFIFSFISLLIVTAGILLPNKIVWIVIPFMITPTMISLATLPLRTNNPRMMAIGSLLTLYLLAVLLTWLYVRSTSLGMRALAEALSRERELREHRDMFINIASHELRTPLTPLLLDCRLIERRLNQRKRLEVGESDTSGAGTGTGPSGGEPLSGGKSLAPDHLSGPVPVEQLTSLTNDMIRHLKRMDAMINILLDASRISLDQFVIKKERCDVAQFIREAVEEQEQLMERQVTMHGAEEPIIGVVDGRRIWQVMSNLVGNALKYSAKTDAVHVRVQVILRESERLLNVAVSDTGPGIPPRDLPHLFERHYRVCKERSGRQAGMGLGLYISSTIVSLHGGKILVDSELGRGSTFTFELPL